jgi:hypothetical protein
LTLSELREKIQTIAKETEYWFEQGYQNLIDWNIGELTIGQAAFTLVIAIYCISLLIEWFGRVKIETSNRERHAEPDTRDHEDLIQLALRGNGHFLTIHILSSGYEVSQPSGVTIHLENFQDLQEYYDQHG